MKTKIYAELLNMQEEELDKIADEYGFSDTELLAFVKGIQYASKDTSTTSSKNNSDEVLELYKKLSDAIAVLKNNVIFFDDKVYNMYRKKLTDAANHNSIIELVDVRTELKSTWASRLKQYKVNL